MMKMEAIEENDVNTDYVTSTNIAEKQHFLVEHATTKKTDIRCACRKFHIVALLCTLGLLFFGVIAVRISRDSTSSRQLEKTALLEYMDEHLYRGEVGWSSCSTTDSAPVCQRYLIVEDHQTIRIPVEGLCIATWHKGATAKIIHYSDSGEDLTYSSSDENTTVPLVSWPPESNVHREVKLGDPTTCKECLLSFLPEIPKELSDGFQSPKLAVSLRFPNPTFYSAISVTCL